MLVVGVVLVSGLLVGAAAFLVAHRWPAVVAAPEVAPATVRHEVRRHPRVSAFLTQRLDPAELTGLALSAAVVVIVAGVAGFSALYAMVQTQTGLERWDLSLARFGAEHATASSTAFLRRVSLVGGTTGVLLLALIVGLHEQRRSRSTAVWGFLALAVLGQFALSNVIKEVVDRSRPDLLNLTGFSGSSFPSGHSTAAAATLAAAALLLARRRSPRTRALLGGLAVGLATMVAASRVLLGVHWFTDVLAGLLLGWLWFALSSIAFGGRLLRFGAPAVQATVAQEAVTRSEEAGTVAPWATSPGHE